jgi:hypothetical protein
VAGEADAVSKQINLQLRNNRPSRGAGHTVEKVSFVPRTNDGPLTCRCSAEMLASQFAQHRRDLGLGQDATHRAVPQEADRPTVWKPGQTCRYPKCGRRVRANKLCQTHYQQQRRGLGLHAIRDYAPPVHRVLA